MGTPAIDFDALARQHGGMSDASASVTGKVDYDALAKQHGAVEGPSVMDRFWKATGLPDTYRGLAKGYGDEGDYDPGIVVHNALKMIGGGLNESGQHTVDAMDAASKGKFLEALGQGVVSVPFAGPMIDKFAAHLENGELPEAAGTAMMLFGPKVLSKGAPIAADAARVAAPYVKAAGKGAWEGATAPVPTHLGFNVPASLAGATGGGLADVGLSHLGIPHQVAPIAGALAPAVSGAVRGVKAVRAARAPVAVAEAPVASPVAAPVAPTVVPISPEPPTPAELQGAQAPQNVGDLIQALRGIAARKQGAQPAAPAATAPPVNVAEAIAPPEGVRYVTIPHDEGGGVNVYAVKKGVDPVSLDEVPLHNTPKELSPHIDPTSEQVVGSVQFMRSSGKLDPVDVNVAAAHQRQGIASGMYDQAKAAVSRETGQPTEIWPGSQTPAGKQFRAAYDAGQRQDAPAATANVADAIQGKYDPYKGLHDAKRDVKVGKVLDQFTKYGFTQQHVDAISPTQWKAVAQAAGIEDLTPTQIEQVKTKFKEAQ